MLSYLLDEKINLFFKNASFPIMGIILGIATNFGVVALFMLAIPSIILYKKNKSAVFLIWLTFFISFILAFILKLIVLRQRPTETFAYPFTDILNYSFPSMHSMIVFSLLPALNNHIKKQKYFWILFACLVSFSRIYFSFHFLSDVVFGAFAGYFTGCFLLEIYERRNHGKHK